MTLIRPDDPIIWEVHRHPHHRENQFLWRVLWHGIHQAQKNTVFKSLLSIGTPVVVSTPDHENLHHVVWRSESNQSVFALINIRPDQTHPETWTDSGFHINPQYTG